MPAALSALADGPATARRDRRPVAPLTVWPAGLSIDDAYEVQRAGEVVISGGLTAPSTLTAGMHVRAVVDRVGTVDLRVE